MLEELIEKEEEEIEEEEEEEDTQHGKFLTFRLGEEVFGIDIGHVTEIIGIQAITKVPEVPNYVKGIINLRGKIIPVIDIRLKFNKNPVDYDELTCIIVIDIEEATLGFIVDSVVEVLKISDDNIVAPPDYKTGSQNKYIKGIGRTEKDAKLLLDCEKIIALEESENINTKSYS